MSKTSQPGQSVVSLSDQLGMRVGVRYTVTRDSKHREFRVGDRVWMEPDGAIMCPKAKGWMPPEDVLKATAGWSIKLDVSSAYRTFGDMCWAVPGQRMDDLEHLMRYAAKDTVFTMSERLTIASFLSAYRELVGLPQRERNKRIKEIRQGPNPEERV